MNSTPWTDLKRPSIDEYFVRMLPHVASRATCPRRRVGAILVDENGKLVATGYNGVPAHLPHCLEIPCAGAGDQPGDTAKCLAIHAEMNAILQAADSRRKPHTLYCSTTPCFTCAKLLITIGIQAVVATGIYADQTGVTLLREAGVEVFTYLMGKRCVVGVDSASTVSL